MKTKSNKAEFKQLIQKYRAVKLDQIRAIWGEDRPNGYYVMRSITYFGCGHCSLCVALRTKQITPNCSRCFYNLATGNICDKGLNRDTYVNIAKADTPAKIYEAINARADYMETLLKQYENNNNNNNNNL